MAATELREAFNSTDWQKFHSNGTTQFLVDTSWCASEERCEVLRRLCKKYKATRVLEVGACCGLASLSMSEVLPATGEVVALEIDPFLADFGKDIREKTEGGKNINFMIAPALQSLKKLAQGCFEGKIQPFDFLMIDADRAGMTDYFKHVWWDAPGLLGDNATVCIDITPFKGQQPVLTSGPQNSEVWVVPSGQDQIDALRRTLEASTLHTVYKVAGLLISHAKPTDGFGGSQMSTPRKSQFGVPLGANGYPDADKGSPSLTHGASPLCSFANDHFKAVGQVKWVPPKASDPVAQLRAAVKSADWPALFAQGKTLARVEVDWSGTEERCALLKKLISAGKCKRVLEIGAFCGISTLSMAEELPADGEIVSLEIDAYLVEFGKEFHGKSENGKKIRYMQAGPATDALGKLRSEIKDGKIQPFDFVVIDADRVGMSSYFYSLWEEPLMVSEKASVCVDIQLYKGNAPVRYVKHGQAPSAEQWIMPSGQDKIEELRNALQSSAKFSVYKVGGMLVVKSTGLPDITV